MVLYDNYCERKIHSALKSIFRPTDYIGVKLFFEFYVFQEKSPQNLNDNKNKTYGASYFIAYFNPIPTTKKSYIKDHPRAESALV